MFKMSRIQSILVQEETFHRNVPEQWWTKPGDLPIKKITLVLEISKSMAYRVYDEFAPEAICKHDDGNFTVTMTLYENEWVYSYILSYGENAKVIEPAYFRENIIQKLQRNLKGYLSGT